LLIDLHPEILTGFESIHLEAEHHVLFGKLPKPLLDRVLDDLWFERLWDQHPAEYHEILMHGRRVKTPRWQVAYGRDYEYTGTVNSAAPVTADIEPFLSWAQSSIAPSLNGALVNFYDGSLGHYIGPHRDSNKNLDPAAPIVIVSTGEARILRFRRWRGDGRKWDVLVEAGSVLVLPFQTNLVFTHEVPASKRLTGRRISMTFRAFVS
jgi:alkylated DNA repair dioxygenase AlkB